MTTKRSLTELTAMIVSAFVSNNASKACDIPALISSTHMALRAIDVDRSIAEGCRTPAVPVEQSITPEFLICLNDGQKLRSLKRYLQRKYSMSPEQYRQKWGLPDNYPMVAPGYAKLRSQIAKEKSGESHRQRSTKKKEVS